MKIVRIPAIILSMLMIFFSVNPTAFALEDPDPVAEAAIVADMDSGTILYEKNMNTVRSPASLTKIMTGLLAVEAIENGLVGEDDIITAPDDCQTGLDEESSTSDPVIQPGEQMKYIDVLYCALLHSANEACNILAETVSGSIPDFVDEMNLKAKELGATNTRFFDCNGLLSDNATSAYDLYLITKEAMQHPLFATIVNTETYTVPATNMTAEDRVMNNSNALLTDKSPYGSWYRYEGVSGVKTGYTKAAGYCLVSTCVKNGMDIICIVMGCNGWLNTRDETYGNFEESIKLYDWVFDNFSYRTVINRDEEITTADIEHAKGGQQAHLVTAETVRLIIPNEVTDEDITTQIEVYSDKLKAPIKYGDELGQMAIVVNGTIYGVVPLISDRDIGTDKSVVIGQKLLSILSVKWVRTAIIIVLAVVALYIFLRLRFKKIQKKHLAARARAEEKRKLARKAVKDERERSRQQADSWMDSIAVDEKMKMKELSPEEKRPKETDLDELIKSLGLADLDPKPVENDKGDNTSDEESS